MTQGASDPLGEAPAPAGAHADAAAAAAPAQANLERLPDAETPLSRRSPPGAAPRARAKRAQVARAGAALGAAARQELLGQADDSAAGEEPLRAALAALEPPLQRHAVVADGNSLFRAVAHQLFGCAR
jgi:hypothetical protein